MGFRWHKEEDSSFVIPANEDTFALTVHSFNFFSVLKVFSSILVTSQYLSTGGRKFRIETASYQLG